MDVVCVLDADNQPHCSPFYIKFKPSLLDQSASALLGRKPGVTDLTSSLFSSFIPTAVEHTVEMKAKADYTHCNTPRESNLVDIVVNQRYVDSLTAFVGEDYHLFFYDATLKAASRHPSRSMVRSLQLNLGCNPVRCCHRATGVKQEFSMWVYHVHDRIVVMDIDGTITRSDVKGYIETVYLNKYSHVHDGVVGFLNFLAVACNCKVLYLTARPLAVKKETLSFLTELVDCSGNHLPDGPLLHNTDAFLKALYHEIITKSTMELKSSILRGIASVYHRAGLQDISPYVLGIGNKEHDALAYNLAGMNADRIFVIDESSQLRVWKYQSASAVASRGGGDGGSKAPMVKSRSAGASDLSLRMICSGEDDDDDIKGTSHSMSGGIGVVVATTRAMDDSISIISSEYVFDTYNDQRLLKYVEQVLKNSSCC